MTVRHAHFAVPVFDRWLVHLPLHDVTALVDDSALRALVADEDVLTHDRAGALAELRRDCRRPVPSTTQSLNG